MAVAMTKPTIQRFVGRGIPQGLIDIPRWAPWKASYNDKRGKFDKIPVNPHTPEHGLSTASPEKWGAYATALATYEKNKGDSVEVGTMGTLAGVCLVMTGINGLIGIDLDGCIDDTGAVAPWATEVVRAANSYTEISPSGHGLRIFVLGEVDGPDWNNHEQGIEVYGGSTPRHLTVSGNALPGAPIALREIGDGILSGLRGMFGRATSAAHLARSDIPEMPDLLDSVAWEDLDLPPAARAFLAEGEAGDDRSRRLHSTGVALFSAGLSPQDVLSVLANNPFAMEVALDHRRQDTNRAQAYLWDHHVVGAQGKARSRAMTAAEFDDISVGVAPPDPEDDSMPTFDDVSGAEGAVPLVKPRFQIYTASDYLASRKALKWFIKGVLPNAELSAVFGASGSGKTFLALHQACCLALGTPWFGLRVRRTKVLYVAAEGASGMRDRVSAWCLANDVPVSALDGWLYILGEQPNLMEKADVKALYQAILKVAPEIGPGVELIVLDTMAQVTPGANENSGEDMGQFLANIKLLGKKLGAHIQLIAHSGKDAAKGVRGWSGIKGALDSEIEVVRTADYRAAIVTKLKDGTGEGVEYRFTLGNVLVDYDCEECEEIYSASAVEGEVLSESGARDVAAAEKKKKKEANGNNEQKLTIRQEAILVYLRTQSRELDLEAAIAGIVAHLTADDRDGVGFTASAVLGGKATNQTRKAYLPQLEKLELIRIENGKLYFLEGIVGSPNAQDLQFD